MMNERITGSEQGGQSLPESIAAEVRRVFTGYYFGKEAKEKRDFSKEPYVIDFSLEGSEVPDEIRENWYLITTDAKYAMKRSTPAANDTKREWEHVPAIVLSWGVAWNYERQEPRFVMDRYLKETKWEELSEKEMNELLPVLRKLEAHSSASWDS